MKRHPEIQSALSQYDLLSMRLLNGRLFDLPPKPSNWSRTSKTHTKIKKRMDFFTHILTKGKCKFYPIFEGKCLPQLQRNFKTFYVILQ